MKSLLIVDWSDQQGVLILLSRKNHCFAAVSSHWYLNICLPDSSAGIDPEEGDSTVYSKENPGTQSVPQSVFHVISIMHVGTLHFVLCIETEQRTNQANSILEALTHSSKQMLTSGRQLQIWTGSPNVGLLSHRLFPPSLSRTLASVQYLIPYLKLKVVLDHHSRCID